MKVLVVGASRGSGAAVAEELAGQGHEVTAFARSGAADGSPSRGTVRWQLGDATDPRAVAKAVAGQDAVVVTLGISDSPFAVRLGLRTSTPRDVRSRGTATVVEAMRDAGVPRLVVQSTYGIGDTFARLPLSLKLFFRLVIAPQVADHVRQEEIVRSSGLDWTIIRPVLLTDDPVDRTAPQAASVRTDDRVDTMSISRGQLSQVLAEAVGRSAWVGSTLSVSASPGRVEISSSVSPGQSQ